MIDEKDSYIKELETLIVEELYPVYRAYHLSEGKPIPELNLSIIKQKTKLPALLRAVPNTTHT